MNIQTVLQLMVDGVMTPICNSNCQEDVDKFLVNLATTRPTPSPQGPLPAPSRHEALLSQLPDSVRQLMSVCTFLPPEEEESLDHQETNVVAYIAGYIMRKLKPTMCDDCRDALTCEIDPDEPSHEFLVKKNYASAKTGLVGPSVCLVEVLEKIDAKYRDVSESCLPNDSVMCTLVETINKHVDLTSVQCSQCHVEKGIVHLMMTIRLHHTLRENNRRISQEKRKSRKTMKFSHV